MISTEDRSPLGGDNTARLNINNNSENHSQFYQYVPSATTPLSITPPPLHNPCLQQEQPHQVVRDQHSHLQNPVPAYNLHPYANNTVAVQPSNISSQSRGLADLIQHHLSSRLIPKLGSIVKRFSLNYSGEGLVTDSQRTRTVRVGIRFQVQVDSFVQNRPQERPRAILRTQSAPPPAIEQIDSGFSSPTADIFTNNRQLALEYNNSNSSSTTSGKGHECCGDSSSGVSSEAGSPTLGRKDNSPSLAFHNRINQALNLYRNQLLTSSTSGSPPSFGDSSLNRRSSVQVYRRGSATPERAHSIPEEEGRQNTMEDSSSFQVLRHFPGSNVNSLSELSWETAAFEKDIRERIQWLSDKVSSVRLPRVFSQLIDFGRDYARENPVTAFILLALCLTSAAPVLLFLVFAVATILVTFLGFLFVEGTLLTVATVIFGGVVLGVGFVTLSAVLLGMLGYFTTSQAYLVVTGKSPIFRFLRKLPLIGNFFPEPSTTEIKTNNQAESQEVIANGKISNGYGPYHGNHVHHNSHYDDDAVDILDSDDEDDIDVDNEEQYDFEDDDDTGNQEDISSDEKKADTSIPTPMVNGHGADGENDSDNSENLAQHD